MLGGALEPRASCLDIISSVRNKSSIMFVLYLLWFVFSSFISVENTDDYCFDNIFAITKYIHNFVL